MSAFRDRLGNDPEVQEWIREARQQGFADGVASNDRAREQAQDAMRNMRRYLWAAVISNGGELRVCQWALAGYDRGDFIELCGDDVMREEQVLWARPKSPRADDAVARTPPTGHEPSPRDPKSSSSVVSLP